MSYKDYDTCRHCAGIINVDPRSMLCPDCAPVTPVWPIDPKIKEAMLRGRDPVRPLG